MKKHFYYFFIYISFILFPVKNQACAYYNPEEMYFNLFAQEMVNEPEYYSFLRDEESRFYGEGYYNEEKQRPFTVNQNTLAWEKYFGGNLTYEETDALLKIIRGQHLKNWKKGKLSHVLSKKLGTDFYKKYQEGLDYLIVAKDLEPYMKIKTANSDNFWAVNDYDKKSTVADLNISAVLAQLKKAYQNTKNRGIQLRYAYQMVRLLHYNLEFKESVEAFKTYFTKNDENQPIYWYAFDQMAGAYRGLGEKEKANEAFFQVFIHAPDLHKSAFISMELSNNDDFSSLLKTAKTPKEKTYAYFLLAYNGYANPIPLMQKIKAIDPTSPLLKVLAVRSLNELERSYLPTDYFCWDNNCKEHKNKRLPIVESTNNPYEDEDKLPLSEYTKQLKQLIQSFASSSKDEFWVLSYAYLQFLEKDYNQSLKTLNQIKATNQIYINQIEQMKMLIEIVSQPKIDTTFENYLTQKYPTIFNQNLQTEQNTTLAFIRDILANRYFLQKEYAKSFLMNNTLVELQYVPDLTLTHELEDFYKKKNKTSLEKFILKNMETDFFTPEQVSAYFQMVYGDYAMQAGDFEKAVQHYEKVTDFRGITRGGYDGDYWLPEKGKYDGFHNISPYVFGINNFECFNCGESFTMRLEKENLLPQVPTTSFSKLELAETMLALEQIGKGNDERSAKARELMGNMMYNTSALGYFRELFVQDLTNGNSPKYRFDESKPMFEFYYKNYGFYPYAPKGNFDLAISYYQQALEKTQDKERKAQILFQMASAEQGKYYVWEATQNKDFDYYDPNYDEKMKALQERLNQTKNQKFRTAFSMLKKDYADTQTVENLLRSCSYFNHYFYNK
ncbi:hypothetical protein KRX57_03600 [Weeksellaceae bacterium TAE3-ERU29]|nr:hypothetical protein [Weeksellaceae bacterium TAE3-ERU29]